MIINPLSSATYLPCIWGDDVLYAGIFHHVEGNVHHSIYWRIHSIFLRHTHFRRQILRFWGRNRQAFVNDFYQLCALTYYIFPYNTIDWKMEEILLFLILWTIIPYYIHTHTYWIKLDYTNINLCILNQVVYECEPFCI